MLMKISNVKDLPDRIYVLLKENFDSKGLIQKKVREFSKPSFRNKEGAIVIPSDKNHKRIRPRKQRKAL
jgi:hypothetical protein